MSVNESGGHDFPCRIDCFARKVDLVGDLDDTVVVDEDIFDGEGDGFVGVEGKNTTTFDEKRHDCSGKDCGSESLGQPGVYNLVEGVSRPIPRDLERWRVRDLVVS